MHGKLMNVTNTFYITIYAYMHKQKTIKFNSNKYRNIDIYKS